MRINRRNAVKIMSGFAGAALTGQIIEASSPSSPASADKDSIVINPTTRYELTPHLYMQFMEPLGATI